MSTLQHCMQCTDRVSGKVGSFLHHGDLRATSPVFPDLLELFRYMRQEGLRLVPGKLWEVEAIPEAIAA